VYSMDLRKRWDLKDPAWRYDIMPEIMDGKNVSAGQDRSGGAFGDQRRGLDSTAGLDAGAGSLLACPLICSMVEAPVYSVHPSPQTHPLYLPPLPALPPPQILDFVDPDIDARLEALEREEDALAAAYTEAVSGSGGQIWNFMVAVWGSGCGAESHLA
jgi:hypothetical protein